MIGAALLIALAGARGEPPIAALSDPSWAIRRNHALAIARARALPPFDSHTLRPLLRRSSPDGPLYRLPVMGSVRPDAESLPDTGLSIVAPPGTPVVAPAAGRVAYAGPFRRYGQVLILDHGHGWTSVLTGLAHIDVAQGTALLGGDAIGAAGKTLHIQLLHHGRAADVARIAARLGG